jgi:hypothetical protein
MFTILSLSLWGKKTLELKGNQGQNCILNEMLGYSFWNLIIDYMHK